MAFRRRDDIDDCTLLLTFARPNRCPAKAQIEAYFDNTVGVDVVEAIHVGEPPIFARVILRTLEKVDEIMQGEEKVVVDINGVRTFVRRYVINSAQAAPAAAPPAWLGL